MKVSFRLLSAAASALIVSVGCSDDPVAVDAVPAAIRIVGISDTILFSQSITAGATITNASGLELTGREVLWRTSDAEVLAVTTTGEITGLRPGNAFLHAQSGAITDSVSVQVSDRECGLSAVIPPTYTNINGGFIFAGSFWHPISAQSQGVITFGNESMLAGVGVLYGTSEATTSVGYFTSGFGVSGGARLTGRVCAWQDESHFRTTSTLSNLDPVNSVPGLQVEQETYSFSAEPFRDFILFRYRFTNVGSVPVTGLRYGMSGDFDVGQASSNTAHYDPARRAASVRSPVLSPAAVEAGVAMLDEPIGSFRAFGQQTAQRSHLYSYLTGGIFIRPDSLALDWKLMIGSLPINLAPGESMTAWFAVAAGVNTADFRLNVDRAGATVLLIQ